MPRKVSDTMNRQIDICGRLIGADQPAFIVAELSANHGQQIERARQLIGVAGDCGADAVKLQTYTPDTLTIDCQSPPFQIDGGTIWDGMTLYELYERAHTPWPWHKELRSLAEDLGLVFFSTPFDETAVDFLESLNVAAYKVASFELVDTRLLKKVAATGRPVILSTGMASFEEVQQAVTTLRENGAADLALLKCTSSYPARADSMNLRTIPYLADSFDCVVGLSDHTLTNTAAVASIALGGAIIEKHLTISRDEPGPDSAFSLEPAEFAEMVRQVREAEQSLGEIHFGAGEAETVSLRFRRSLFAVKDIKTGETISPDNVRSIRPGDGLAPCHFDSIVGKVAAADVTRGTPLQWKHVA